MLKSKAIKCFGVIHIKRWITFSVCLIILLNSFVLNTCAVKIDGKVSPGEGWTDAYSVLLVDSVSESCNKISYARVFAMNEGDYLYLKLDAIDGAAPDGTSPEGIEISINEARFSCFFDENSSSDYDKNSYSFEYVLGRSIDGFDAEICIVYKSGLPDTVSLTFVLTDNAGEKSVRLPFNYTVTKEESTSAEQSTEIRSEKTTVKSHSTTKKITTTAHTTTATPSTATQTTVIEPTSSKATNRSAPKTTPKTESTLQTHDVTEVQTSPSLTGTAITINAGALINSEQVQTFQKKKLFATVGCAVAIIAACVAGTVNFKKQKKNDDSE